MVESSWYDDWFSVVLLQRLLMCGRFILQNIFDKIEITNQIMVIDMLHNWNHMYSNHYRIIKCVCFKSIHYTLT